MTNSDINYYQSVAIAIIALNCLSIIGLILVIGVYIVNWKKIASFPMRLCFYLSLASFGQALTILILNPITIHQIQTQFPNDRTSGFCIFQGIVKSSFDLSSIIWTTLILYSAFASVVWNSALEKRQVLYLLTGFLLPVLLSIVPGIFQLYGYNIYFCWFNSQNKSQQFWLKMTFFYLPMWVAFFINLGFTVLTIKKLSKMNIGKDHMNHFKRLTLFPLILLLTSVFSTLNTIYFYVTGEIFTVIEIIGVLSISTYGFFTSLAYGFNPVLMDRISSCFCPNQNKQQTISETQTGDTEKLQLELFEQRKISMTKTHR